MRLQWLNARTNRHRKVFDCHLINWTQEYFNTTVGTETLWFESTGKSVLEGDNWRLCYSLRTNFMNWKKSIFSTSSIPPPAMYLMIWIGEIQAKSSDLSSRHDTHHSHTKTNCLVSIYDTWNITEKTTIWNCNHAC